MSAFVFFFSFIYNSHSLGSKLGRVSCTLSSFFVSPSSRIPGRSLRGTVGRIILSLNPGLNLRHPITYKAASGSKLETRQTHRSPAVDGRHMDAIDRSKLIAGHAVRVDWFWRCKGRDGFSGFGHLSLSVVRMGWSGCELVAYFNCLSSPARTRILVAEQAVTYVSIGSCRKLPDYKPDNRNVLPFPPR